MDQETDHGGQQISISDYRDDISRVEGNGK